MIKLNYAKQRLQQNTWAFDWILESLNVRRTNTRGCSLYIFIAWFDESLFAEFIESSSPSSSSIVKVTVPSEFSAMREFSLLKLWDISLWDCETSPKLIVRVRAVVCAIFPACCGVLKIGLIWTCWSCENQLFWLVSRPRRRHLISADIISCWLCWCLHVSTKTATTRGRVGP